MITAAAVLLVTLETAVRQISMTVPVMNSVRMEGHVWYEQITIDYILVTNLSAIK